MLLFDLHQIDNRLLAIRKRSGLTQAEAAEAAGRADVGIGPAGLGVVLPLEAKGLSSSAPGVGKKGFSWRRSCQRS